jgi:hypothetical protein
VNTFDKAMTALISVGLFTLGLLALCLMALFLSGCAHQPLPVIPVQPLEEVHLGASIGDHVVLCVENPDQFTTKPRWACLTMESVRRWFAVARVAD